jgi:hypothetical protein
MDIVITFFILFFPSFTSNFTLWMFIVFICFSIGFFIHNQYMSNKALIKAWENELPKTKKYYKISSLLVSFLSTILFVLVAYNTKK